MAEEVDEYGHAYAVFAICQCGHARELVGAWLRAKGDRDMEFLGIRTRLKCTGCGARMPRIEVYRRPT